MPVNIASVLVADAVHESCDQILREYGISVTRRLRMTPEELLEEVKRHDALVVRSESKVTAEVVAAGAAASLRAVARAGTGVDNIDVDAATRRGVIVLNTPGGNSVSACELTCSLITVLARNVPAACQSLKEGRWERSKLAGSELSGKTLAVLGLGRIGREVAARMRAFGMTTIGFDPLVSAEAAQQFGVEKLELEEIWPRADYITVHTPLIPQTRNLINDEVLSKCKRGVRIVNVARGGIIDEKALLVALNDGRCGGAALDVLTEEPPRSDWLLELVRHPQVVATPHLGASTAEAQRRVAREAAEQLVALSATVPAAQRARFQLTGVVNAPALSASLDEGNQPWLQLAKELGSLAARLVQGSLPGTAINVTASGPGSERLTFVATAAVTGLLSGRTPNGLNLVNAPALARDMGVTVTSEKASAGSQGDDTTVTVKIQQASGEVHAVTGTVRADNRPLLLSVDGCVFDGGIALGGGAPLRLFRAASAASALGAVLGALASASASITGVSVAAPVMEPAKGQPTDSHAWIAVRTTQRVETRVNIPGVVDV
ncbi:D-3-phosphoglycerate dehydrogenase [Schistocerca serialis cubense]|uniref:D-3-phosphoglycerate dehydrogenase n=1 Tax=Schistocerca serialis cubense TaxID=2023355 RepID=UPI00214E5ADF|nr:D-3-phosphoglycerate dehydrogenase [Schistocerca serialis cubense]